MRGLLLLFTIVIFVSCEKKVEDQIANYPTVFETSKGVATATYQETIEYYSRLAKEFPKINLQTIGHTDIGIPLHIATFNPDGDFNFQKIGQKKTIILINNGIHPGESDGIDATMMLYRDLAIGKIKAPENTVLVTIPIYNIGGSLNRNTGTRANQNGPESYGFRGNAQNYDLNRDFIKADSENAKSFAQIYHLVQPDIFIDNHVSNGADYQYTLTHLFTQHNKLGGKLGAYIHDSMMPELEQTLAKDNWDITPYVNVFNRVPETGFSQFLDLPRYSSGYTTLWNTLGMMVETHMLKPYKQRVEGTYELMVKMIDIAEKDGEKIKELRKDAFAAQQEQDEYYFKWEVDTTQSTIRSFKGFEGTTITSEVTGLPRLKYDRSQPFTKEISYQEFFFPKDTVSIPTAYVIKKGWQKVIDRLDQNQITYTVLNKDSVMTVESYKIGDYETRKSPYEGHYLHYNTTVDATEKEVQFTQGDIVVPARQKGMRYILETLEPAAEDSFFNWNFFDPILQRKEGFSPYVFEDLALELLNQDESLRLQFHSKKATDKEFSENWYAQLSWIYERSNHYEKAYLQYPVYRLK